ncbi:hypothetical protein HKK52_06125 [Pseudomonas sp. ADAK2]|uniref:hypothetical protein n=1 Tax=unclassified Pseudomonas TaxID=196821 RepID=UPI00146452CE|nr:MULTISPECIES: hypothetical protein [unclassified Pseudomonas]QJI40510.1 hypothetical protein HKK53_06120 [Pseudomonas sp. ADAK7]QJI46815.1 hypothetical protein HKK52_06125 [Pseudomonas sp. ADAK2]
MSEDQKEKAIATWRRLLEEPEIRMSVEEQFEALVMMADELKRTGVIDREEWRELAEEASAFYAHTIEGLEGGT